MFDFEKPKQTTQCQIDPLWTLFTLQPQKTRHLWTWFWKLDIFPFPTVHQPAHNSFVIVALRQWIDGVFPMSNNAVQKSFSSWYRYLKNPTWCVTFETGFIIYKSYPFQPCINCLFTMRITCLVCYRELPMGQVERLFVCNFLSGSPFSVRLFHLWNKPKMLVHQALCQFLVQT